MKRDARPGQLALRFPVRRQCTFESFEAGPGNAELVARLRPENAPPHFSAVWLLGEPGSGKSHLLQAACDAVSRRGGATAYLPSDLSGAGTDAFDGLEAFDVVAVDDLEAWLGDADREAALLALYQGLAAGRGTLLVASATPPTAMTFVLGDLASRLRAAEVHRLSPLDDPARTRLVQSLARGKGLALGEDAVSYLLRSGPRGSGALCALLDRLDAASLASQRRVTIPLIRAVLDEERRA